MIVGHDGPGGHMVASVRPGSPSAKLKAPRQARLKPIPYPELPEASAPSAIFWRAAWLRAAAELQALQQHRRCKAALRMSEPLQFALIGAQRRLGDEAREHFDSLIQAGGLLYAWIPE